jgi:peptide/nickel transport system substrate-binding protein
MRRTAVLRAAALIVGTTLVVSACGGSSDKSEGQTGTAFSECDQKPNTCNFAEPDEIRNGGQLAFGLEKNVANWNALSSEGSVFETGLVLMGVLPYTFVTQPDLTVTMNKNLLESAEMTSSSPQRVVYRIRKNATWSDGMPIAAEDFVYNWKVQNGRDCPSCVTASTSGFNQVQSVIGSDNGKTVTATFSKPFTDWKQLWGSGGPIYPAHIAAQHGDITSPQGLAAAFTWFGTTVPNYSGGPFQIEKFNDKESVVLVPNPKWYGARPRIDRLIYRIITDAAQEPIALQNREVQVIYPQPEVDLVQQVRKSPGVSSFVGLGLPWEHVDFNLGNAFLTKALRIAMFTAIDRQAIIDKTVGQFTNKVKPLNNHNFVLRQKGYEDVISDTGQGSGNIQKAKQILTDAGYHIKTDRLITPDGKPVPPMRIRYTSGNQIRQIQCELLAQQAKPLGITVQLVSTDSLGGILSRGDYDIAVFAWMTRPFPYGNAVHRWVTGQGNNFGRYSNPEVDRLINAAATSTDTATADQELNQADQLMTRDAYVLPLYQKPTFIALWDTVANVRNNSSADGPLYNVQEWGIRVAR